MFYCSARMPVRDQGGRTMVRLRPSFLTGSCMIRIFPGLDSLSARGEGPVRVSAMTRRAAVYSITVFSGRLERFNRRNACFLPSFVWDTVASIRGSCSLWRRKRLRRRLRKNIRPLPPPEIRRNVMVKESVSARGIYSASTFVHSAGRTGGVEAADLVCVHPLVSPS